MDCMLALTAANMWGFRKNLPKYFPFVHVELFRGSIYEGFWQIYYIRLNCYQIRD